MTEIFYSRVLDVPAEKAWAMVRDFGALAKWFPFIPKSVLRDGAAATEVGAIRDNTTQEGAVISEKLIELSDRDRRLRYEAIAGDIPMTDYTSTLTIFEVSEGDRALAVWTARYEPVGDPAPVAKWVHDGIFKTCLVEFERVLKAG
ncbi:MAG: SRPBCC family protein [Chloroflexota bacterium]|nr:SRPBCC family protein [Chloroflexota bacterium]